MANPFQRYQSGGFEAVPGIAQAGANIGSMLGSGFSNLGSSLASGLKEYYDTKAKSEAANQEIELKGQQLLLQREAFLEASGIDRATLDRYMTDDPSEGTDDAMFAEVSKNPMVQYAKQLDTAIQQLKVAPAKGLNAKLQAVNAASAAMGQVEHQMKINDFILKNRLEQTANQTPDTAQVAEDVVTPNVLVDPNNPFFKGVRDLKANLEKTFPDQPDMVQKGVREYIEKVKAEYANKDMTPEQKSEFAYALGQYAMKETNEVGELTDFGKMRAEQDASYEQSMADAQAAEAALSPKAQKPKKPDYATQAQGELTTLQAKMKELKDKIDSGEAITPGKRREAQNWIGRQGLKINEAIGKQSVFGFAEMIRSDVKITPELADVIVKRTFDGDESKLYDPLGIRTSLTGFASGVVRPYLASLTGPYGWALASAGRDLTVNETRALEDAITRYTDKQKLSAEEARTGNDARLLEEYKKEEQRLKNIIATNKKAPRPEEVKKATTPEQKPQSKPFSIGELNLGERMVEVQLNAAEKESVAREFYAKRFGSVPAGFTQMYRQMYPEAAIRTTTVNGIPVMVDGKGNVTPLTSGKEQDIEKIASAKALTFQNTEIADGVILDGIFGGTVAGAQAFRKDYAHMANVRSAIDELITINDMGYESLSPTARARADQLQSEIIAALRIPIVGPGQVAIPEQAILERIVRNPTAIFSLESQDLAALKGLKSRVDRELVNWPKSMGLNVRVGGQGSDVVRQIRSRRLRAERNLPPSS
jgi:hypothetical protein